MCYHYKPPASMTDAEKRFSARFSRPEPFKPDRVNGFTHPHMPVILDNAPTEITLAEWGILPFWAKDKALQKNTLNCMIETAAQKTSFKNSVDNRCLILASAFYEWKHEIVNGKLQKIPYALTTPDGMPFALAGLYNNWNGTNTFTILTTAANELMAEIHNSKKRMPVVLRPDEEKLWLGRERLEPYHDRTEVELIATQII